jgi:hypothetical protein
LFSKLVQKYPPFNEENQDPEWKKAVIVQNGNHAKGNEKLFFTRHVL